MSNRINQLIEECTSVYDDIIYDGRDTRWKTTEYFDKQKFAELIVRECANVANSGIDPAESHLIGNDILEHFGVEE
jgi:hypothetical protein